MLFTAGQINTLKLPHRIARSTTAERLTDAEGRPTPPLLDLYRKLSAGSVGLIITGHLYLHPSGKCHPEMTAIDDDSMSRPLICEPDLPRRLRAGQERAACISGNQCWPKGMDEGIACKCPGVERP
ncbi:MAG: hypothetical protein ACLFTI_09925 [Anaerolineales bacterium]